MKHITTIRHSELFPGESDSDPSDFKSRHAARAIITNDEGSVALLFVSNYNFHKLPGGGVEAGEDIYAALERELIEEVGCHITNAHPLGEIIEYRDTWEQIQTSECFIASQFGNLEAPAFTPEEIADGFKVIWATDLSEAIAILEKDQPQGYGGLFMQRRDLAFLHAAQEAVSARK